MYCDAAVCQISWQTVGKFVDKFQIYSAIVKKSLGNSYTSIQLIQQIVSRRISLDIISIAEDHTATNATCNADCINQSTCREHLYSTLHGTKVKVKVSTFV